MLKLLAPNLFTQRPDAILFDTDNTLYPYDPAHAAAHQAVQQKAMRQFSLSAEQVDSAFAEARNQVKARLKHTAACHNRLLYMQRMLEIIGLGSQVLLALDFEQTYWRTFLSHAVLFDEVTDLLDDLRLLSIPTAIVTDLTAQIQFRKMVYFGLDKYFDFIVTSEEAGFDKPNPAPFHIALEKLRLSPTACVWMIGDNPVNDIQGAKQHINAVTLQKMHHGVTLGTGDCQPDACFNDFADLRKLLARLDTAEPSSQKVTAQAH